MLSPEELSLKQGVNILSFTVINGGGDRAAVARFPDKDNNPIEGLHFSAEPPEK